MSSLNSAKRSAIILTWLDVGLDNILASLTTCIKEKLGEDELDYFDSSFTSFCSNSSDQCESFVAFSLQQFHEPSYTISVRGN